MINIDECKDISIITYMFVFAVGFFSPFAGRIGQLIGLGMLFIILSKLMLCVIRKRHKSYLFAMLLGFLSAGQIYFRDFVVKGFAGYMLVEYSIIIVGLFSFPVVFNNVISKRYGAKLLPYTLFCIFSIASLSYSLDPLAGRQFIALYLSGIIIIAFVLSFNDEPSQNGLFHGLILGSVLVFGVTVSYYLLTPKAFLEATEYRFGHYLVSAVQVGTTLALGGFLWFCHNYEQGFKKPSVIVAVCLMVGSCITMTRTSTLALLLSMLMLFAWRQPFKKVVKLSIFFSMILALLITATIFYRPDIARKRFLELTADQDRLSIWKVAVEMFSDSPVGGYGVGSWGTVYPNYAVELGSDVVRISDAHNIFVQALAESGFIGGALIAIFFFMLLICSIRAKNSLSISFLIFVLVIATTGNLKLVSPYFILGLSLLYSQENKGFPA